MKEYFILPLKAREEATAFCRSFTFCKICQQASTKETNWLYWLLLLSLAQELWPGQD